jgi:hypothetical protein
MSATDCVGTGGTAVGGTAVVPGIAVAGATVVGAGPQELSSMLKAATIVKRNVMRFIFFILLLEYGMDRISGSNVYSFFYIPPPSKKRVGK